nr:cytochrome c oxidase subunit 2 [Rhododendron x pulchrum]UYC28785.1 cytochrome c oxidase subunit 2 [Rhododendron x pulchrum]
MSLSGQLYYNIREAEHSAINVPTPPDGGLIPTASCDAAEPWQLGSQDAATPMMQGIIDLHHDIFFFLILILVFVSRVLVRALWHFHYQKNPIPQRIVHGTTIEIIRTIFPSIIPMFIAIPSFALLYSMDEVVVDPAITIKAIGHQWYRTYEYSDYNSSDEQSLTFDSYTIPEDDPELGQSRLLEVDNRVVVPAKTHLRIIVTSADVLHSWAVPSSGVKCDAVPGGRFRIFFHFLGILLSSYLLFSGNMVAFAMENGDAQHIPGFVQIPSPARSVGSLLGELEEALPQVPDPQLVEVPSPAPPTLGDAPLEEPRIGGESVSQIYLQLLCKYRGKGELPEMDLFWERAESIFRSKSRILLRMEELDPGRGWLVDGARFLKTIKGQDFSEKSLNAIFKSLGRDGRESPFFGKFYLSKRNHRP